MALEHTRKGSAAESRLIDWNSLRLLLILIVPFMIMAPVLFLWPDVLWVSEKPYTAIGILGSFVAVLLSVFVLARYRERGGVKHISAGLMAIGIIDGLQSLSSPETSLFVWLHAVAGIGGSAFFAFCALSQMRNRTIQRDDSKDMRWTLAGVVLVSVLAGVLLFVFADRLPAMTIEGRFTNLAWSLNMVPVGLYLFSGVYLFSRYRRTGSSELLMFTAIVIFLFQSAEVFYFADLWGIIWWFWLALRLGVYLFVLSFTLKEHIQTSSHLSSEIEERSKAESELRKAESDWRNSFDSLEEIMLIVSNDYSINKVNRSGSTIIGKTESEMTGRKCYEMLYGRRESCGECPFESTFISGQVTSLERFDERFGRHFNVKISPILDDNGAISQFVYLLSDITDRIKAEEKEKMMQRELNLTSRLASIGEVAAGIAHEINNPLTSIIAFTQMMQGMEVPEDMKEAVEVISDGSVRIAGIVDKLHTFARRQKPVKEPADINAVISRVIGMRSYEMRNNNIEILTRLDMSLPWTMVNVGQMQQVFLNIIINAEQAVKGYREKGEILVSTANLGAFIRISITDNGPGINQENLDRIFDPFFTTKDSQGGTGLGLSISYGIIKEHDGRIYARSEPDNGATFTIEVPVVDVPEQRPDELLPSRSRDANHDTAGKAKVLVIDDEFHIRRALERLLSQSGHYVETTGKAKTAIEILREDDYDVILLDIKMPGMNGIQFYEQLKYVSSSLQDRVVCITGDIISSENRTFLEKTGVTYVTKPFSVEALIECVKTVIQRRKVNAEIQDSRC